MPSTSLILILTSVALSAGAQMVLKIGMISPEVSSALSQETLFPKLLAIASSPLILIGLGMYFLSAVVWLGVLARVEVSFAYPFVGLGFAITLFLGWWLMGDTVGPQRIAGTILVIVGVVLVAKGG